MSELPALTTRQRELLGLIRSSCLNGKPPTFRELQKRMGVRSPNGIADFVSSLRRKGYLAPAGKQESRFLRPAEPEIAARRNGDSLTVSTTGPVTMTREAWRQWWEAIIGK